jgi:CheY-like chemotaxis protein
LARPDDESRKELKTVTSDLFLSGAAAAAVVALVLLLRSGRRRTESREDLGSTREPSPPGVESRAGDAPHELLVAWVQFLKSDIMEAVNTLNNRLNVISHTAAEVDSEDLSPEMKKTLERIRSEGERAAKITTGLFHRVNALAPDTMPPILFEYDGGKTPPGRILIVEDDDANRTVMGKMFNRLGHRVTAVTNGFEAFSAMETDEPDCIIADVRLPYLDGRTLFEQVEQHKPHLAGRFVFVTGDYTNPATIRFLQATGQPYVGKPYEMETLLGAVAAILQNRIRDGSESTV